jgi:hypothetical protein
LLCRHPANCQDERNEWALEISRLILDYLQILVWPAAAVFLLVRYQPSIERLLPGAKIAFKLFNVTIETTLKTLQRSVEENFQGKSLSDSQWEWLTSLKNGQIEYQYGAHNPDLRDLRNAGLIRPYPTGYLTTSKEVVITALGRLLVDARQKSASPPSSDK